MSVRLRPSPPLPPWCQWQARALCTAEVRVRLLPEAPSHARSSAERALSCDGRGRWFESSREYHFADVAQTEEHRGATPGRPVRSGSSALSGLWCKRKHGELQPRWSGFDPWQACSNNKIVAGRSGSVIWRERLHTRAPLRFDSASRPHHTTATCFTAAGRNGSGYRLLIDRSRVRVPPGAFGLR